MKGRLYRNDLKLIGFTYFIQISVLTYYRYDTIVSHTFILN